VATGTRRKILAEGDIFLMDAAQDCRSDVGGFIGCHREDYYEKFCTYVVVYEGLHTYGGMTGRAMEVFSLPYHPICHLSFLHFLPY